MACDPVTIPMSTISACHCVPGSSLIAASSSPLSVSSPPAYLPNRSLQHPVALDVPVGWPTADVPAASAGTSGTDRTWKLVRPYATPTCAASTRKQPMVPAQPLSSRRMRRPPPSARERVSSPGGGGLAARRMPHQVPVAALDPIGGQAVDFARDQFGVGHLIGR